MPRGAYGRYGARGRSTSSRPTDSKRAAVAMTTNAAALNAALQHHQAGRLDEAERQYRAILDLDARQPDAWHLLGLIDYARRDYPRAIEHIRRAILLDARRPAFTTTWEKPCWRRDILPKPRQVAVVRSTCKVIGRLVTTRWAPCWRRTVRWTKPSTAIAGPSPCRRGLLRRTITWVCAGVAR